MFFFLAVVLFIYGLINFYVYRHGSLLLAGFPLARLIFSLTFLFLVLAYPLGRFLFAQNKNIISMGILKIGAYYLALMFNLLILVVLLDGFRLSNLLFHFWRGSLYSQPKKYLLIIFLIIYIGGLVILVAGALNASNLKIKQIDVVIDKEAGHRKELVAAVASDIHIGGSVTDGRFDKIIDKIKSLNPDIVFLPGDIVDESVSEEQEKQALEVISRFTPPLGIYAVTGNHEAYSGLERNISFLEKFGVNVLMDRAVKVDESFYVIGRSDPSARGRSQKRKSLEEIIQDSSVDPTLPLILLDHQPVNLDEASRAGIDLQLSGHTHAGQLFPLNIINKWLYEQNWGYLRKGQTQYYVSSGAGTWGPPVRTGSRSEIVLIRIIFKSKS